MFLSLFAIETERIFFVKKSLWKSFFLWVFHFKSMCIFSFHDDSLSLLANGINLIKIIFYWLIQLVLVNETFWWYICLNTWLIILWKHLGLSVFSSWFALSWRRLTIQMANCWPEHVQQCTVELTSKIINPSVLTTSNRSLVFDLSLNY